MRVAVFGSRTWDDTRAIKAFINGLPDGIVVVSGRASGADKMAAHYALKRGLVVVECLPPWDALGRRAGAVRNQVIVDISDCGHAFQKNASAGTQITIDMFARAGKPCEVTTA